ncbi:MAG TPA: hypothetical protein VK970_03055 [Candidatus Methylacidiphilales bacterium]|nr:hypothetical protein [Candidatus Methylacidiphilales bacterium]
MSRYLYPRFLACEEEYLQCEALWEKIVTPIIQRHQPLECWEPWMNTTWGNGTPIRDGDNILSRYCRERRRGFTICQIPVFSPYKCVATEDREIYAFTKYFGADSMEDPDAIEMLAILVKLSQRSILMVEKLVSMWVSSRSEYKTFYSLSHILRHYRIKAS